MPNPNPVCDCGQPYGSHLDWCGEKQASSEIAQSREFYIQDSRQYVGNSVLWWRVDGCGYTTDLGDAWRLNETEARKICRERKTDIMWPCAEIDARSQRNFDMQKLRGLERIRGKE